MNKENVQWILLGFLCLGLILVGIKGADQNIQMARMSRMMEQMEARLQALSVPKTDIPMQGAAESASNIFDVGKSHVGDTIVGMQLLSVTGVEGIGLRMGPENVHAKFSGRATVSGKYVYSFNDMAGEPTICLHLNAGERVKLPVLANHPDQNGAFCFSNSEMAEGAFGPGYGEGQTTVIIDNYQLWYAPAEVVNQAELKTVVSKQPMGAANR